MKKIFLIIGITLFITGCSAVKVKPNFDGKATMYGIEYNGRKTASGEIYDINKFTCAMKDVEFGKKVRVENVANGKHVYVVVNDRGPKQDGWIVTLSEAAFNKIADKEKYIEVKVEIVE